MPGGSAPAVPFVVSLLRRPNAEDRHGHQGPRRQRPGRAQVGGDRRHHDRLREAEASVLTEYRGLTVTDLANLRAALRPAETDYKVYKNTLARRAAADAGLTDLAELLEGPVAIAFVRPDGDAVIAAKALRDFAKATPTSS